MAQKPVELGQAARQLASLARKLQALSKALDRGQVVQARKLLAELGAASLPELGALLQSAGARLRRELEQLRADFGSSLERACRESGIPFQLLSREPLAFRLAPLELRVELERGTAELLYARERLERLDTLAAERVLAAYRRHLRRLEGRSWDPAAFHRELRRAWQRLAPEGGRVELSDLLPELVLLRQPPRFRRDPSAHNFRPYSRANFAYDLWRLRRDEALSVDGWRLVLGTATGGSTRDRSRVLFVEGPDGRGQFYLTLRFQREGGAA